MPPKNNALLDRAKELRRKMTPQERKLWYLFLSRYPVRFYRQKIIENYIVDFYCSRAKLVIEVDGTQHFEAEGIANDERRSAVLRQHGLDVLRFSNAEINSSFPAVCEAIDTAVRKRVEK